MSKLFNEIGGNFFDKIEAAGQREKDKKNKSPWELIQSADNLIFKKIIKL